MQQPALAVPARTRWESSVEAGHGGQRQQLCAGPATAQATLTLCVLPSPDLRFCHCVVLQNPFGAAKPREAVLASRTGKSETEILKAEVQAEKPKVGVGLLR